MLDSLIQSINQLPLTGLMLVTSCGFLLGRVSIRNVSLGPAGGTLFIAIILGVMGISMDGFYKDSAPSLTIGMLGFVLFIYSVGFEAGPRFFASFVSREGWRFVAVGVMVNILAVATALVLGNILSFSASQTAGILAGALTSAPTFAAASEVTTDPDGLSVAFALTYPVGLIGLVLVIQSFPSWLHHDLSEGTTGMDEQLTRPNRRRSKPLGFGKVSRAFIIRESKLTGTPLRDLEFSRKTGCVLSRVMKNNEAVFPNGDLCLEIGDHVLATGRIPDLNSLQEFLGSEIPEVNLTESMPKPRRILVRNRKVIGINLSDLRLIKRYNCIITRIQRGEEWIEPGAEIKLERNDIVEVTGPREAVRKLSRYLGQFETDLEQTNIAIYTGGIFIGILIGSFQIGQDFTLGSATGLLIAGLVLGWKERIGIYSTQVPGPARHLVRDFGILLFIGETGLQAGAQLSIGIPINPLSSILVAIVIMIIAVFGPLLFGIRILKLKPLDSWGSLCGGLTSSAALHILRRRADTNEVTISYAAAYTVASIMATLAGPIIIRLSESG